MNLSLYRDTSVWNNILQFNVPESPSISFLQVRPDLIHRDCTYFKDAYSMFTLILVNVMLNIFLYRSVSDMMC